MNRMTTNRSITHRIIAYLAEHGDFPGKTRGEIADALNLPPHKECGPRIRDARKESYGSFDIRCHTVNGEYRYWLPIYERERAKSFIKYGRLAA